MRLFPFRILFLFFFSGLFKSTFAQLATPNCIHGTGIQYLLDVYLAQFGACNCQRSGVILTSFPKCDTGPFVVDFEDNFDGSVLDTSKWELPGAQGALEGAQNIGLYTLNNSSVSGGICHLTAKKETITARSISWQADNDIMKDGLPNLRIFNFTSGMLWSKKTFFYGKYEARCRMPAGKGFWPAFWTFGGIRWNEIDFFDTYAGLNEYVNSLGHDFEGRNAPNGCNKLDKGFDFSAWHIFTCIFDYDKMTFLIDGEIQREVDRVITLDRKPVYCGDEIDAGTYYQLMAYPMEPMSIILNLALLSKNGPADSSPIDDSTPFPSSFDVDYVRYWKRVPASISLYPNPGQGKIKLHSNTTIKSIEIDNLTGQPVYKSNVSDTDLEVDLSAQPDGVYILTAELEGVYKTLKIVKIGS
jgi:beta-glucanase (GH16 family)